MPDVQFSEESYGKAVGSSTPALMKLVMRWGLAKNEKEAQLVLLVISGIALVVAGFIAVNAFRSPYPEIPEEELNGYIQQMNQQPVR